MQTRFDELHLTVSTESDICRNEGEKVFSVSRSSATDCLVQIELSCNCHLYLRAHLSHLPDCITGLKSCFSTMFHSDNTVSVSHM